MIYLEPAIAYFISTTGIQINPENTFGLLAYFTVEPVVIAETELFSMLLHIAGAKPVTVLAAGESSDITKILTMVGLGFSLSQANNLVSATQINYN